MSRNRKALALAAVLFVAVVAIVGCTKKPVAVLPVDTPNTTVPATESVTPPPPADPVANATGPVTTPAAGSDLRTTLMDAAREKLGSNSQFVVYQLSSQGDYAVGDIETATGGKRQFVAWKGPEWKAVWVAPFASTTATAVGAKAALPDFSAELLKTINWSYKKPASNAAMLSSLTVAAKKWTKQLMDGVGDPYNVTLVKVAKDSKGVWWGRAVVQPAGDASNNYESIEFWAKYQSGAWVGKAQDPEPPAPGTYFPSSVVGVLGF